MHSTHKHFRLFRTTLLATAAALTAAACGSVDGSTGSLGSRESARASAPARTSRAALEVERAARQLDVGKNATGAEATLRGVLADPAASREDRDRASLQLARALDAEGKKEQAVETVENLLRAHVDDHQWPLDEAVSRELRKLLTGKATEEHSSTPAAYVSPFARALARFYPVPSGASPQVTVSMLAFGGDDAVSGHFGTFNIPEAIHAAQSARCPLCANVHVHMHEDNSDWVQIPAYDDRLATSLDVFYFDLGADRIPKRYEKYLPMPIDQIVLRLNRGEGLIVAHKRQNAPPVLLLAAPRRAQLADVEKKLASLDALPAAPLSVNVPAGLKPGEIQSVVRSARGAYKRCYNALLAESPKAAGKLVLSFAIQADGSVSDAASELKSGDVGDATFQECVVGATSALHFPKTGRGGTTVRYPIEFSPDGPR